jgi:DNA repair protein RecO
VYSIITTKAIVLKSFDSGEKDATLSLFTKDLGQIYAKVSAVRDLKSKHRYALQDHSISDVSLVQGKNGWRITSSKFDKSLYFDIEKEKRETVLNILNLVRRFYLGEEANEKVFEDLILGLEKLQASEIENAEQIEVEIVFSFLADLGYIEINHESLSLKELRKAINEGIKVSRL